MAYKDKEKQRETTRLRVRRYRALHQGVTEGVTRRYSDRPKMGFEVKPLAQALDADGYPIPES